LIDPTSFAAGAGISLGLVVMLGCVVIRFNRTARRNVVEALRPVDSSAARIQEAEDEYTRALCRAPFKGDHVALVQALCRVPVPDGVTATRAAQLLAEVSDLRAQYRIDFAKQPVKRLSNAERLDLHA